MKQKNQIAEGHATTTNGNGINERLNRVINERLDRVFATPHFGIKFLGSLWLMGAAWASSFLAILMGASHGGGYNDAVCVFFALAALFFAGIVMIWRRQKLHWLTLTAFVTSVLTVPVLKTFKLFNVFGS